jgi:hypothetical protein
VAQLQRLSVNLFLFRDAAYFHMKCLRLGCHDAIGRRDQLSMTSPPVYSQATLTPLASSPSTFIRLSYIGSFHQFRNSYFKDVQICNLKVIATSPVHKTLGIVSLLEIDPSKYISIPK